MSATRTIFFVSDGTGITAETMANSLLSQFEHIQFRQVRMPFVDNMAKMHECIQQIRQAAERDALRPIVISTLINPEMAATLREVDALILDFFSVFIAPLETELGVRSTHAVGRSHGRANTKSYDQRIEAINFTLAHRRRRHPAKACGRSSWRQPRRSRSSAGRS